MRARCALALLALAGCDNRQLQPIDPTVSQAFEVDARGSTATVDLLFVIDDSFSMQDEQESLRREIPQLVRDLTSPPLGDDGAPQWNAAESLRVAVVTSNMGTTGFPQDTDRVGSACAENDFLGDDGVPRDCGSGLVSAWEAGQDVDAFVDRIAACGDVGSSGCGLEQPLLSAVSALGQAGFPREDALLAVVVMSDEEDCSMMDPAGFFAGSEEGPKLNQLCYTAQHHLVPVTTIVESLVADRDPADIIFAALVGLPEALTGDRYDAMLTDPAMNYVLDDGSLGVLPACERPEPDGSVGTAAPGRRYVETARALGGLVASICAASYRPAIDELTRRIGGRVKGICTTRELQPDELGSVRCSVRETLPPGMTCDDLVARTFVERDMDGNTICTVAQAVGDTTAGWFYDTSDATCAKISYTEGVEPPVEVGVTLSCLSRVEESVDPGSPAGP
ncbi:MAG: hypothetical protein CMN30_27535 [Sandaracinus sp.]|nr:hypothetical protein [Sandaracinus sp.]|tara:strand:+ start:7038 stop:8387 length:1350 start_codon:yes stop_codon:yes gene_type:complete